MRTTTRSRGKGSHFRPLLAGQVQGDGRAVQRFVGASHYVTEAEKDKDKWTWRKPGFLDSSFDQTDEHPVVCVSWNDAKAYRAWVAEKTARSPLAAGGRVGV